MAQALQPLFHNAIFLEGVKSARHKQTNQIFITSSQGQCYNRPHLSGANFIYGLVIESSYTDFSLISRFGMRCFNLL